MQHRLRNGRPLEFGFDFDQLQGDTLLLARQDRVLIKHAIQCVDQVRQLSANEQLLSAGAYHVTPAIHAVPFARRICQVQSMMVLIPKLRSDKATALARPPTR